MPVSTITPPIKPHQRALPLKVGTRGSPLARTQTATFLGLLEQFCPVLRNMSPVFEEHIIVTTGRAKPLSLPPNALFIPKPYLGSNVVAAMQTFANM